MRTGPDAATTAKSIYRWNRRPQAALSLAFAAGMMWNGVMLESLVGAPTAASEVQRREAQAARARELMAEGDALVSAGNDGDALVKYREAVAGLPAGATAVRELRAAATKRFGDAATRHAETLATRGEYERAAALLNETLTEGMDPSSEAAKSLKEDLKDPDQYNPALTPRHSESVDKVRQLLRLAGGHRDIGDYRAAKAAYNQVLAVDETNVAARRGLEEVERYISNHLRSERDYTRVKMLNEVDRQWETAVPVRAVLPGVGKVSGPEAYVSQSAVAIKLDAVRIPRFSVSDLPVSDALTYLARKSAEAVGVSPDENSRGVNIVWNAGTKAAGDIKSVTLDLRNVTVRDALRSICEVTETRFRVDASAVVVYATGGGGMTTRQFRVPPGFLNTTPAAAETAAAGDPFAGSAATADSSRPRLRRLGAAEFLARAGVPFPEGASASYNPTQNLLTVTNTEEGLDLVASLTDGLVATEQKQVVIKVTQLQCAQTNLRELGFDWFLEPSQVGSSGMFAAGGTSGGGELGSAPSVGTPGTVDFRSIDATFNVTQGPLTGGLRSSLDLSTAATVDTLLSGPGATAVSAARPPYMASIAGVMTNPRFQTLMRGLDQKKGVDLATAQSIVVKSGQKATGFSGRTMLYPSEFDPPQIPQNFGGGGTLNLAPGGGLQVQGAQSSNNFPVTPANPNSFTPRDIGSTIEVEPTVGDDGYTVNLDLSVVFSEFEGFINYGTPITNGEVVLTENRIIQPVFSKTAAAAQVMVYDGETVAIGGLRQEKSETINDKVPVLGSLPVVGRLFKSQVQRDSRKVMIYLVSVNIIDPSGGAATAGARAAEAAEAGPSDADGESILLR